MEAGTNWALKTQPFIFCSSARNHQHEKSLVDCDKEVFLGSSSARCRSWVKSWADGFPVPILQQMIVVNIPYNFSIAQGRFKKLPGVDTVRRRDPE